MKEVRRGTRKPRLLTFETRAIAGVVRKASQRKRTEGKKGVSLGISLPRVSLRHSVLAKVMRPKDGSKRNQPQRERTGKGGRFGGEVGEKVKKEREENAKEASEGEVERSKG